MVGCEGDKIGDSGGPVERKSGVRELGWGWVGRNKRVDTEPALTKPM